MLGERARWEKRAFEDNVPPSSKDVFGANVASSVGNVRISTSCDRLEQGNNFTIFVALSRPPNVCS
jgi:hypothetical protein